MRFNIPIFFTNIPSLTNPNERITRWVSWLCGNQLNTKWMNFYKNHLIFFKLNLGLVKIYFIDWVWSEWYQISEKLKISFSSTGINWKHKFADPNVFCEKRTNCLYIEYEVKTHIVPVIYLGKWKNPTSKSWYTGFIFDAVFSKYIHLGE